MKTSAIGAVAVLGALSWSSGSAQAAIAVFGGGFGEACWRAALASTFVRMDSAVEEARWKADSIGLCDEALSSGALDRRDLAATYVNRGILEMSRESYGTAERNFHTALTYMPNLAEAHVDLGSSMINMKRYKEGVAETEHGISLGSKEPERAYFNLGIAYELMGDLQKAYDSYKQASELAPEWQAPKDELARFTVETIKQQ